MKLEMFSSNAGGRLLSALLIAFVALIAYSNTFNVPFQFDDNYYIVNSDAIKDISHIWAGPEDEGHGFYDLSHLMRIRLVGFITFAFNYALHGFHVSGYHALNILIHILNAMMVYRLVIVTFRTPYLRAALKFSGEERIALFSALLFVSHPVQTEAVTYITQRFASLVTLFYLLSLIFYAKWRLGTHEAGRFTSKSLYILSVFFALLAVKTKENAFTLPMTIALYEFIFFNGKAKKRVLYILPHLAAMMVLPLGLMDMDKPLGEAIAEATRTQLTVTRWEYLVTQLRVLVTYVRLLLFPINQNLDYDYEVLDTFVSGKVLLSFLFLGAMFWLGLFLLCRSRNTNHVLRMTAFGIFWFFITISVESSILPLSDVIFEHRLYMPSIGIMIAAVSGILPMVENGGKSVAGIVAYCFFAVLLIVFVSASYARNTVWQSEVGLWEDVVIKSPRKSRVHVALGRAYENRGFLDKAMEQGQISIALDPNSYKGHYNLGNVYGHKGLLDKAVEHYKLALNLKPDYIQAHNNLGSVYNRQGRLPEAEEHFLKVIEISPDYAEAYNNLGVLYGERGLAGKAMEYYSAAIRVRPDFADAYNNIAVVYLRQGLLDEAIRYFQSAVRYKRNFAEAHYNLAIAYRNKGMLKEAEEHYRIALKLNPGLGRSP